MKTTTIRGIVVALASLVSPLVCSGGMAAGDAAKELTSFIEEPIDRPLLPPGTLTVGARFSEDLTDGYADLIVPFWAPGNSLFFLNPKLGINDESQDQYSIGLGWRHLFPEQEVIIGANAFYDYLNSRRDFEYHQAGFGAELLTRWVDARFNYYLPDNDRNVFTSHRDMDFTGYGDSWAQEFSIYQDLHYESRLLQRREAALEGFYAEAGFLTPWIDQWLELRWFGGYYHYDNHIGRDIDGWKARVEARVLPAVLLDVEYYEDDELMGGHWTGGVRVSVPFEIGNIFEGRNPFEGICDAFRPRKREFAERMTEMVVRSPRIRTSEDEDYVEDKGSRRKFTETKTIADTVVFVDNQSAPGGIGTFEDPVNLIQDGVNTASANFGEVGIVLVRGGGANYAEEVTITANSVAIYGGACAFPVFGGETFQFGPAAVVTGGFWAQSVASFTVDGFVLNGGHALASAAVRADNVLNTWVTCNTITTTADGRHGVFVTATGASDSTARVADNTITTFGRSTGFDASSCAAFFQNAGSATLTATVSGNDITTSGAIAVGNYFQNRGGGLLTATVSGNDIATSGASGFGNWFDNDFGGLLTATVGGNDIATSGPYACGNLFDNYLGGPLEAVVNGNEIATLGESAYGNYFRKSLGGGTITATVSGNDITTSGAAAFGNSFLNESSPSLTVTVSDNDIATSGAHSYGTCFYTIGGSGPLMGTISGNDITTSGGGADAIRAQESAGTLTLNGSENNQVQATGAGALKVNWVSGGESGTIIVNGSPVAAPTDLP